MKYLIIVGLSIAAFCLNSCGNKSAESAAVEQGGNINTVLSVADFEKKLTEQTEAQLIDVRTAEEFSEGHLKAAQNLDFNGNEFEAQVNKLDKNKAVFVYCLSGGRSASAAELMGNLGFKEVYNMEGGMMKWNAEEKPVEHGLTTIEETGMSMADFTAQLKTEKYVLVDYNAKWCTPCKRMKPWLEALAQEKKDQLVLLPIDADKNKDLLKQQGIDAVPVLALYKNGKLIWSHSGLIEKDVFLKESGI